MKMASLQSMVFPFPSVSRPWESTVTAQLGSYKTEHLFQEVSPEPLCLLHPCRVSCLLPGFSSTVLITQLHGSLPWAATASHTEYLQVRLHLLSSVRAPNHPWHPGVSLISHAPIQYTFLEAHSSPGSVMGHWGLTEPSRGVTLRKPAMTSQCIKCYDRGSPGRCSSEERTSLGQ